MTLHGHQDCKTNGRDKVQLARDNYVNISQKKLFEYKGRSVMRMAVRQNLGLKV